MVFVTGSTGFVGRYLVKRLVQDGRKVRCLARSSSKTAVFKGLDVEIAIGDVSDQASLDKAMNGIDQVIHLVAVIREYPRKGVTFERINVEGTRNVVAAAKKAGVKRFVHQSALGARDDSNFPYLHSKWFGEQVVQKSGLEWTISRPSIIIGEGDEFLSELKKPVTMSPFVPIIGSGRSKFQYIWVEDVARCLSMMVDSPNLKGRIIEIGGPHYFTYEETVDMIAMTLGKRRAKVHIPIPVMAPIVRLMGVLLPRPPLTHHQLRMISLDNITELDSVRRNFGFDPRPVSEIIGYLKGK